MRHYQLNNLVEELIPSLYGFAYAISGDRNLAEQLITDAYTVYIVREKRYLLKKILTNHTGKERRGFKKYLYKELLCEIMELAKKRLSEIRMNSHQKEEYTCFFRMNVLKRGVLYLKEVKGFTIQDIQEIFGMERHRAVELYYNARHEMVQDIESLYREEMGHATHR